MEGAFVYFIDRDARLLKQFKKDNLVVRRPSRNSQIHELISHALKIHI